jgi:hypothetical protein
MSRKSVSVVIGSFLVAGFALGAVQGCGSSSSSTDPTALCTQSCVKVQMCLADASASSVMSSCMANCASGAAGSGGQTRTCTNEAAIETAYSNCLKISDCTQFEACLLQLPACQTSTGTGGTNGTGGTTGAAGAKGTGGTSGAAGGSGSASCSACDKAPACCTALGQSATTCAMLSTASCNTAGANQATVISACQQLLSGGAALSPACQ